MDSGWYGGFSRNEFSFDNFFQQTLTSKLDSKSLRFTSMLPDETLHHHEAAGISKPEQREIVGPSPEVRPVRKEPTYV